MMIRKIIFGVAIAVTIVAAYSCNGKKSAENQNKINDTLAVSHNDNAATSSASDAKNTVSIKEIVNAYLQMKNSLTEDNSSGAATAGKKLEAAIKNFDKSALTEAQKETFKDVEVDAREHAEHIGANGDNIAHQREHFELLSIDIYDLVKAFGGGQVLYKDYDPMFNNGKGAFWLSETQEIKNPYMGKAMVNSGTIQEEIK